MKRSERLGLVERVVRDEERRRAERLAACERRVDECEARLAELESWHASYARDLAQRTARGIGAAGLREYQTFLARLAEAVRQQGLIVLRARAERDAERLGWQGAAQRAEAVSRLVQSWRTEEHRALEREEQRQTDERAQRHRSGSRGLP